MDMRGARPRLGRMAQLLRMLRRRRVRTRIHRGSLVEYWVRIVLGGVSEVRVNNFRNRDRGSLQRYFNTRRNLNKIWRRELTLIGMVIVTISNTTWL